VGERLAALARARGVPVAIYRPGRITGESRTGTWNAAQFPCRVASGCLAVGSVPAADLSREFDATPVDYVSRAIVHLSLRSDSAGRSFHVFNPQPIRVGEALEWIRARGHPLRSVPPERWYDDVLRFLARAPENPLYPMLPLLEERRVGELGEAGADPASDPRRRHVLERTNTEEGLAGSSIECPRVDAALMHRYLAYLERSGAVEPPGASEAG
jgi:thioester reductase-like protein